MSGCSDASRYGAKLVDSGVRFAVWAPVAKTVEVMLGDRAVPMVREDGGRFVVDVPAIGAGTRYRFRFDGRDAFPDPYSRFQPDGVHGDSEVIDPTAFRWTNDTDWKGLDREGQVIYELHVGTMTTEGTFRALADQLAGLVDLGITAIELMPVAQCPGQRNWGYDGVDLFAPSHAYGRPDDLRALVDTAHRLGLGVILDVVYNHLGPEGNYLRAFAPAYFTDRHQTPWGDGLNWDGPDSAPVRQFAIDNACSWISEYHIDGLRLDATHALVDDSAEHIVEEIVRCVREAAGSRSVVVYAEDGTHEVARTRREMERPGAIDGIWADDFHHEVRVFLTHARENYYGAYSGTTSAMVEAISNGLEQSFEAEAHPVGSPIEERDPASAFVTCIQNHDQIGNRPFGDRLHHDVNLDRYLVASALLLVSPETPLLFMGQEFAASTPFLYFTDHPDELGWLITEGRRAEFAGFPAFTDERLRDTIPDPQAEATFLASKLRLDDRITNAGVLALYRALIAIRRQDPVLSVNDRTRMDARAVSAQAVTVHRWTDAGHRLLVANFGGEARIGEGQLGLDRELAPSPRLIFSSADPRVGGTPGQPAWTAETGLVVPPRSATIWAWE